MCPEATGKMEAASCNVFIVLYCHIRVSARRCSEPHPPPSISPSMISKAEIPRPRIKISFKGLLDCEIYIYIYVVDNFHHIEAHTRATRTLIFATWICLSRHVVNLEKRSDSSNAPMSKMATSLAYRDKRVYITHESALLYTDCARHHNQRQYGSIP